VLVKTSALPALTALAVTLEPSDVPRLFASGLVGRLEHLRIRLPVADGSALTGELDPLRWRRRAEALGLRSFEMDVGDRNLRRSTRFSFRPGSSKTLSRNAIELDVDGGWLGRTSPAVVGVLERLPRSDVESLGVQPRQRAPVGPALQMLAKAVERLGGTLDLRPGAPVPSVFS